MISVVVVSHSHALAQAAVQLAREMVPEGSGPRLAVAAGLDETTLGTDAAAIAAALEEVDSPDGVLVLVDLGSALLSTEMALEFVDPELAARVKISAAPLVEGLVAAVVSAASGAGLDAVNREACRGLAAKQAQLGVVPAPGDGPAAAADHAAGEGEEAGRTSDDALEWRHVLDLTHGLHARPAGALVSALTGLDAEVTLRIAGRENSVDAASITQVQTLGARCGDELVAELRGPDAELARRALDELARASFGENADEATPDTTGGTLPTQGTGSDQGLADHPAGDGELLVADTPSPDDLPVHHLDLHVDTSRYLQGAHTQELDRIEAAVRRVDELLQQLTQPPADQVSVAVLGAIRAMLHDPGLAKGFRRATCSGHSAPQAVRETLQASIEVFQNLQDAYLRERATDLRALQRLLLTALVGLPVALRQPPAGHAVQVPELDAVVAAQLDPSRTPLVLVDSAEQTGHGVIVARARGLGLVLGPR